MNRFLSLLIVAVLAAGCGTSAPVATGPSSADLAAA
jgi:hypothetical protein